MSSGDIKGFYRQKKQPRGGGLAKSNSVAASSSSKKKSKKSDNSGGGVTLVGAPKVTPALRLRPSSRRARLISQPKCLNSDDYSEEEERLRDFDMDMRYGPCVGMTRLARWERSFSMGLQPPAELRDLLIRIADAKPPELECLWEGRV